MTHPARFAIRQRGATLVIALIMLVLLTLFAVSSMNTANTNLRVVGNMQSRNEALYAAQETLESVISTPQFIADPANAVPVPCGAANTTCTDVTGDGNPEYTTTLTPAPTCVTVKPIKNETLNIGDPEDLGCSTGQQNASYGIAGAATGDSLCASSVWEVSAETTSATTGAAVTVRQGVGVRISADDAAGAC